MITLTGIDGIGGATTFELNPALVGRATAERPALAEPIASVRTRGEFGANLKYGITSNLTLDATWNPDFSQVESDAGQLEINNRFALFFPEKRPFFLEGTDIFPTRFPMPGQDASFITAPLNLFYSRRIIDPDAGVKLTGRLGGLSLGVLGAIDAAADYELSRSVGGIPPNVLDPFRGRDVGAGVVRTKLDVLADGYIGGTLTARRFADGHGLVGSLDSRLRFGRNTTFRFLVAATDTREPDVQGRLQRTLAARLADPAALIAALDSLPAEAAALDGEAEAAPRSRPRSNTMIATGTWGPVSSISRPASSRTSGSRREPTT